MSTITTFDVDRSHSGPQGSLCIIDPFMIIRPAVPGQYPASAKHDAAYANTLLDLGNGDANGERYEWHIITKLGSAAAHRLLDNVFRVYVDACCFSQYCDARVRYVLGNGDRPEMLREYGMDDGRYTMVFTVHCNVTDPEAFVTELSQSATADNPLIVVRPSADEPGYTLQGYASDDDPELDETDEFDFDDYRDEDEDDSDDEDYCSFCGGPCSCEDKNPLEGDIDDGRGYIPDDSPLTNPHYFAQQRFGF